MYVGIALNGLGASLQLDCLSWLDERNKGKFTLVKEVDFGILDFRVNRETCLD